MRTTLILTALAASLALAGCGEHGGIGVEATNKTAVSGSTEMKTGQSSELKQNTAAKATISIPAMSLILKALPEYLATQPNGAKPDPHVTAAREILSVTGSIAGWPVACFGCSAQESWARRQAVRVAYANLVLTDLSDHLPTQAMVDSAAARKAIIATFLAIPSSELDAAHQKAEKQAHGGSFTPDFSGVEGVHFLLGTSDFKGGPAGWSWADKGVPWYGDNLISGRKVEVALDRSIDSGTTRSSGSSVTTGTSVESANSGSAGVK